MSDTQTPAAIAAALIAQFRASIDAMQEALASRPYERGEDCILISGETPLQFSREPAGRGAFLLTCTGHALPHKATRFTARDADQLARGLKPREGFPVRVAIWQDETRAEIARHESHIALLSGAVSA
jgi:hypothetical protein